MNGATAWAAVRLLARHELRGRWRSVVALGVASGIFFGGRAGDGCGAACAQTPPTTAWCRPPNSRTPASARTTSSTTCIANGRCSTQLALVRGSILKRTDVVDSQQLTAVYTRRDTRNVEYLGVWAPRHQWDGLDTPVVVDGRLPSLNDPNEVMVNEQFASRRGWRSGRRSASASIARDRCAIPAPGSVNPAPGTPICASSGCTAWPTAGRASAASSAAPRSPRGGTRSRRSARFCCCASTMASSHRCSEPSSSRRSGSTVSCRTNSARASTTTSTMSSRV